MSQDNGDDDDDDDDKECEVRLVAVVKLKSHVVANMTHLLVRAAFLGACLGLQASPRDPHHSRPQPGHKTTTNTCAITHTPAAHTKPPQSCLRSLLPEITALRPQVSA